MKAKRWQLMILLLCCVGIAGTGCRTTTTIDFEEPGGTALVMGSRTYQFPAQMKLPQRTPPGTTVGGRDVVFIIPHAAAPERQVVAKGLLYVYKVQLSDVDRLARNYFRITSDKIQSLLEGAAVTIEGLSADGAKELYRVVIGLDRENAP
ncbi:MAG: hypothetical protein JXR77_10005 [Lentisphaeria bacterium]|nr:hypothetical protein [Lentisphaeria bacterium]